MIYTGKGDGGETDLASGERVSKTSERIEAYGTLDELNSLLGLVSSRMDGNEVQEIQNELHILQAELADRNPETVISEENINRIEEVCNRISDKLPPLEDFVIPGGSETSSLLHLARSICRRAERRIVDLDQNESVREELMAYINRLSDLLFLMARHENYKNSFEEKNPEY